jgi:hypothetical protein
MKKLIVAFSVLILWLSLTSSSISPLPVQPAKVKGLDSVFRVHNATGALAVAGYQDFVIQGTSNLGYPGTSQAGTDIPFRIFTPPQAADVLNGVYGNEYGMKFPLFLCHHGCGEKTDNQPDRTNLNTSELGELVNTTPWSQLQNSSGSLWNRSYKIDDDGTTRQAFWATPQLWGDDTSPDGGCTNGPGTGGYTFTYMYLTYYLMKEIRENWSHIVDTTRIVICGLSQGGGAANLVIQDSILNQMFCAGIICCAGYDNYTGFAPTGRTNSGDNQNLDDVASSGIPLWYLHSADDNVTSDCGGGSGCSRTMVAGINARNPLYPPIFTEFEGTSHSLPYNRAFAPNNFGISNNTSNGETVKMNDYWVNGPLEWAVRHTKTNGVSRRPDGK